MVKFNPKLKYDFKEIVKSFIENVIRFCQNTVLHGFSYIGNRSLSAYERLYFFFSFAIIFAYVITLTSDIYDKWQSTPVIVGISPSPVLINKLPFPAVTICNVNQARNSRVRHLPRDSVEYSMLQMLCYRSVDNVNISELADIQSRSDFQDFIARVAQPCENLFISCKFGGVERKCEDIFRPVLTDEGQCCVFNALHSSFIHKKPGQFEPFIRNDYSVGVDWDAEEGYQKRLPKSFYPRKATGTGISQGLEVILNAEVNDYHCSMTNGPGFKLYLHNPREIPTLRENGLYMKVGSEMNFRISADSSEASETIRHFSVKDRQCVYKSERQLGYFKTYSKRNCEIECVANMTANVCGCMNYFLPKTWRHMRACSLKDQECRQPILVWTEKSAAKTKMESCQDLCMQGCFDLFFNPTRFAIPLTSGGYMIRNEVLEKYNISYIQKNIAVVHLYYKLSHFDGFMRTRYVGTTEFLSNIGGLIGLLGFSFIALAEIVYFFIMRPLRPMGKYMVAFGKKFKKNKETY